MSKDVSPIGKTGACVLLALVLSCIPTASQADPINTIKIDFGSLVFDPAPLTTGESGAVSLGGEIRGFTFNGTTSTGMFAPGECRDSLDCVGGRTVDLHASWTDLGLGGNATLDGVLYSLGTLSSDARLTATWTGTLTLPEAFTGGTLNAPFQFDGLFSYAASSSDINDVQLIGSGTAALRFSPWPGEPGAFLLDSARYDFGVAPVPEPASLLLLGTGLAGLVARRRLARASSSSPPAA